MVEQIFHTTLPASGQQNGLFFVKVMKINISLDDLAISWRPEFRKIDMVKVTHAADTVCIKRNSGHYVYGILQYKVLSEKGYSRAK